MIDLTERLKTGKITADTIRAYSAAADERGVYIPEHERIAALLRYIFALEQQWEHRSPTEWAYDRACAARECHRERSELADDALREISVLAGGAIVNAASAVTIGIRAARTRQKMADIFPRGEDASSYQHPPHGWTCFHCGETFLHPRQARQHFGETVTTAPVCQWLAAARHYLDNYPVFRSKPVGAPHSPARLAQDAQIRAEDALRAAVRIAEEAKL